MISTLQKFESYFEKNVDITRQVSDMTKMTSEISYDSEKEFGFAYNKKDLKKRKNYNIWSFWSIGMSDPFPDESTVLEKN